jgi:hypothetical protein
MSNMPNEIEIPKLGDLVISDYGVKDILGQVISIKPFETELGPNAEVLVEWRAACSSEYAQDLRIVAREHD